MFTWFVRSYRGHLTSIVYGAHFTLAIAALERWPDPECDFCCEQRCSKESVPNPDGERKPKMMGEVLSSRNTEI